MFWWQLLLCTTHRTSVNEGEEVLDDFAGIAFDEDDDILVVDVSADVAGDAEHPIEDVAGRDEDDPVRNEVASVVRDDEDVAILGVGTQQGLEMLDPEQRRHLSSPADNFIEENFSPELLKDEVQEAKVQNHRIVYLDARPTQASKGSLAGWRKIETGWATDVYNKTRHFVQKSRPKLSFLGWANIGPII